MTYETFEAQQGGPLPPKSDSLLTKRILSMWPIMTWLERKLEMWMEMWLETMSDLWLKYF
jgi:hypothetical protein